MANKNYRLNFGMSDGTTKSVDFAIPYDDSSELPPYWQPELDEGVAAINSAVESAGRNKSAFLWYTDAHWGYSSGMAPKLLAYLHKHTAMGRVNFGGDIANDYKYNATLTDAEWMEVMRQWRSAIHNLPNHHSVIGNHDVDGTVQYFANKKHLYGFLMSPEETSDIVRGGDFYYYIDEPSERTRYLYLNTSFCTSLSASGEDAQGQFVVDTLSSTQDGWHIVVISHIWFLYNSTSTPTVGSVPTYCNQLLTLFDAYNDRKTGSITLQNTAAGYDFTNAGARVEFCIGGHTHVDHDFTSNGGIPVILTETDSYHTRGDSTRQAGTITEASVSGIIADYDNHKISVIRIGRGNGREIAITKFEVAYTNMLDSAGFKENTYISASSGYAEKSRTGVDLSGYIPVKAGDVVRLKNITMPDASDYNNKIYYFNSTKTGVNGFSIQSSTTSVSPVFSSGNLVQFTILENHIGEKTATGYIRIGATNIDSTSIVTVNEEIG